MISSLLYRIKSECILESFYGARGKSIVEDNEDSYGLDNPSFTTTDDQQENGKAPQDSKIVVGDVNDEEDRAQWGNGLEFLMSCIAMSVGLGNIWRFPFTAYENGGGAFLIPYIIVLLIIGRPIYYMEMALGQFSSRGNVKMFEALSPGLKGVGYGQLIGTICVATYYCSLMAITLFYLFNSFTDDLPWSECQKEWQDSIGNATCIASKSKTNVDKIENSISSSELWFTKEVLKEIPSIEDGIGYPEWRLALCLLASWICTFIVSRKGVQSSGKAAYFLALFPYVVMVALLIRAVTLDGSTDGIMFFIRPQWEKLLSADVWYAAVTQCFFSLNVGFGSIIMYSSYNNFDHNINRDALVVTTLDTFTSLLAGTTIFGILGNLAHELGVEVKDVVNAGGTGLAFISYPEAIAKFESVPWLFAILFFVMLFVLGVGSLVALQGCAITVIQDSFPSLHSWQVSAGTALAGFLIGLVYVTPGGQFILNLVDHFGGTFVIFVLSIIEILAVMWYYGLENFCIDMEFMLKRKVGAYWRITWGLITPVLLIVIFAYFIITQKRLKYGSYDYPDSTLACGWLILVVSVVQLIMWMTYYLYSNREYGYPEMVSKSFGHENWGPKNKARLEEYLKFKEEKIRAIEAKGRSRIGRMCDALLGT